MMKMRVEAFFIKLRVSIASTRVQGFGIASTRVQGFGFRFWRLGFTRAWGLGFTASAGYS